MSQAYSRKDDIHFDLSILHTVLQIKILKDLLKHLEKNITHAQVFSAFAKICC